jgi:hypothetical protein
MALHKPILVATDLPAVGSAVETSVFDMKREAHRTGSPSAGRGQYNQFELAKDVAMFANAAGGVVLIGAAENGTTGVLQAYHPVSDADAKDIADAFGDAVANRCHPAPLIEAVPIQQLNGYVVAVNIAAFPGQPVGVRIKGDRSDGFGGDAFVFPLRIARRCDFITPEQLPMLMLPAIRHAAIRLSQIPQGAPMGLRIANGTVYQCSELQVDIHSSTVTLKMASGTTLTLPIEAVGPVWLQNADTLIWLIQVIGTLRSADRADGKTYYQYGPT